MEILFEDNHIIVVQKPQNVLSQGDETGDQDMLGMVKNYIKEKYQKPGNVYVGLVHRLDRPTGGVMVFAKTSKAATRLAEQIQNGEFKKEYLCVVCGHPRMKSDKLINYLEKDPKTNNVRIVPQSQMNAKRAELDYVVQDEKDELSLVKVHLATGRSHQIRVQMASIKCPIFGDYRYGKGEIGQGYNLALWAVKLSFLHPVTKERMTFKSLPPLATPWKFFDIEKYVGWYEKKKRDWRKI